MSSPNSEQINNSMKGDEYHSLGSHEIEDVGSAAVSSSVPITSEGVERQIRAASNPLKKRSKMLCDLMRELRRDTVRRDEGTFAYIQGPSEPRGASWDMVTRAPLTTRCELLTGPMNPMMKQPDNKASTR